MATNEFGLRKIETHVLKVHVNCCIGCRQKVKKILKKIDGVYGVSIDPEKELVTVHGTVGSEILVQKLVRSGKHAEVCSTNVNNNKKLNHGKTSLVQNLGKNTPMHSFFNGVNRNRTSGNSDDQNILFKAIPEENVAAGEHHPMGWNTGDNTLFHHHNGFGGHVFNSVNGGNPIVGGVSHYGHDNQDMQVLNQNLFLSSLWT